jgi:hypothetical protein
VDYFFQYWPIVTSVLGFVVVSTLWAAKIFFMLQTVVANMDTMQKNLSTHQHDPDGNVVIPAR